MFLSATLGANFRKMAIRTLVSSISRKKTEDIYKFRTSPLRNLAVQPAFFHNGAFTSLSEALRHHLDAIELGPHYDPVRAGVAADLTHNMGPIRPVLRRLDPALSKIPPLSEREFSDLLAFLRDGLLDPRARPEFLKAIYTSVRAEPTPTTSLRIHSAAPRIRYHSLNSPLCSCVSITLPASS